MIYFSGLSGQKICVALSGGVDSVTLLHKLRARQKTEGFLLSAVHCEHGIRGEESVADGEFARSLCKAWNIPFFYFSEDCIARAKAEKTSLETAARNFRYEKFQYLKEQEKIDYIATAHHKDDAAETALFRLARGTSLTGVRGLKPQNGTFLRPLLDETKAEIIQYARENGLSWREDRTNAEKDAVRNKLRLEVLPKLEEAVAGAAGNLVRFAALAEEDDALLYSLSQALLQARADGSVFVAFSDKKPLFRRASLTAIKSLGLEKDYTLLHLESVWRLSFAERGAAVDLPKGLRAVREKDGVLFTRQTEEKECVLAEEKPFDKNGFDGGRYEVSVYTDLKSAQKSGEKILRIDEEKLPPDVVFRFRREGDKIRRFGGGTKSLKKFFNEEEISPKQRAAIPLIAQKDGDEVFAVCGAEISERVKVDETTKSVLYIVTKEKEKHEW